MTFLWILLVILALVGPSGAGKTTVVNLLLRFLDPEAGRVTVADETLASTASETSVVRSLWAVRSRTCSRRASGTTCGWLAPTRAIPRSSRRCGVRGSGTGWSGLPKGVDTVVGEQGGELSGGQRQRIVLARALLAAAPVLVLDEPTAQSGSAHRQRADCRCLLGGPRTERAADHASDRGARARCPGGFAGTPGTPNSIRHVSTR